MTDRQEPGPIADEAARLVEAALERVRQTAPGTGHPGEECTGCPFCRALRAIRRDRPELAERLTGAVVELAGAAAAVMRVLSEAGDAVRRDATEPRGNDSDGGEPRGNDSDGGEPRGNDSDGGEPRGNDSDATDPRGNDSDATEPRRGDSDGGEPLDRPGEERAAGDVPDGGAPNRDAGSADGESRPGPAAARRPHAERINVT